MMGDIGVPQREVTFEPLPEDIPVEEPSVPEEVPAA